MSYCLSAGNRYRVIGFHDKRGPLLLSELPHYLHKEGIAKSTTKFFLTINLAVLTVDEMYEILSR